MRRILIGILSLVGGIAIASQALAERRVALVVGNSQYAHTQQLPNPRNDAQEMASSLQKLGFEVTVGYDLDQVNFARTIDEFARALDGADVGLFFYAGHGLQINEKNYLVSTEAKLDSAFLVPSETIELDAIVRLMESKVSTNLVFLDACRNNPLADNLKRSLAAVNRSASVGRGLARVESSGRDTLVAFSAAPGQEAADGHGGHSPFTASLLKRMPQPGVEVSVMLKQVAADVREETRNAQRPQQVSDMTRTFYFVKDEPTVAPASTPAVVTSPNVPVNPDRSLDMAFWQSASAANDCESVRVYLRRFPNGSFADLAKLSERRLCGPGTGLALNLPPVEPTPPTRVTPSFAPSPAEPATTVVAVSPPADAVPSVKVTPVIAPSTIELARNLQTELIRVGCGVGKLEVDGNWNAASRDAVRSFNERTRSIAIVERPTMEALALVRSFKDRVCEPTCAAGTELRGANCVAVSPAPEDRRKHASRTLERSRPARARHSMDVDTRRGDIEPHQPPSTLQSYIDRPPSPHNRTGESWIYVGNKRCKTFEPQGATPRIICP